MGYIKKILNNCHEVSILSLKGKEEPLPFKTKMEVLIHIAFCNCCKNFIKQSEKIDLALKSMAKDLKLNPAHKVSIEFKDELKNRINQL